MTDHSHDHTHTHGHHGHDHSISHVEEGVSDRGLIWAGGANVLLTVFQVIVGVISGSIALVADALHNLNDALALVVAYVARRIARRRADVSFTFGYRRAELIGATINLTALVAVGLFLIYEAVQRLFAPTEVMGLWVMIAAGVALIVDVVTAVLLWATSQGGLNLRAVFIHNMTDALASVAVLAGGAAVYFLHWNWIDPALTLLIAGYVLIMSIQMLRRCVRILMEGTPEGLDVHALHDAVVALPQVRGMHHLHVWELDEKNRALEAHVVLDDDGFTRQLELRASIKELLRDKFDISHSTLEIEALSGACCDAEAELITDHR